VGRRRKNPSQGLPVRMYIRSGTAWYVHRNGSWQKLGRDLDKAAKMARDLNAGKALRGTMAYWLEQWHLELNARVKAGDLAARTRDDYIADTEPLKSYFGAMAPEHVLPANVKAYLTLGRDANRAVRANREKAALSSCFTWMVEHGHGGIVTNPCRGVKRNPEVARDRYLEDDEVAAVFKAAGPAEKAWAEMIYRTLQRPSDILRWTKSNLVDDKGRLVLKFRQSKTGAWMRIVVTPTLKAALDAVAATRKEKSIYLISREDGKPYTELGLASMFRRATVAAGVSDCAPYDLKAKGATDMYEAGTPIEEISQLCGHESTRTTEVYIKQRLQRAVMPNDRVLKTS
jgi:integrase